MDRTHEIILRNNQPDLIIRTIMSERDLAAKQLQVVDAGTAQRVTGNSHTHDLSSSIGIVHIWSTVSDGEALLWFWSTQEWTQELIGTDGFGDDMCAVFVLAKNARLAKRLQQMIRQQPDGT